MRRPIVLGLLPNPSDAEATVNNLVEQEVSQRSISVVTASAADARAIIDDAGPLVGATAATLTDRLTELSVPSADAEAYAEAVLAGQALIAVSVSPTTEQAVVDTLRSDGAQRVQSI